MAVHTYMQGSGYQASAHLLVQVLNAVRVEPGVDPGLEVGLVLLRRLILRGWVGGGGSFSLRS